MFALPGQHIDECIADIDQAARQGSTHVSAYHLTYEEGTAFHRWRSTKRLVPLDEDAEAEMFDATRQRLAEHGFAAYEISNFARPGFACRHNLVYWRARDYLGVGAGAYSYARAAAPPWGRRWCNVRSPAAYLKSMRTRRSAEADAEALDAKQAAGEFVFLHLRTMAGMDQSSFRERFGSRWGDVYPEANALVGDGLLEDDGSTIRLTPRGVRFADSVFSSFF